MTIYHIPIVLAVKAKTAEEANAKVGHIMDAASHETANYSPKLYKAWKWWRRVNELTPRNP